MHINPMLIVVLNIEGNPQKGTRISLFWVWLWFIFTPKEALNLTRNYLLCPFLLATALKSYWMIITVVALDLSRTKQQNLTLKAKTNSPIMFIQGSSLTGTSVY